ncbi:hypothetical protein ASF21_12710 [Arthrobacter sp. Leaf234]|uniref:hypothetical protein n=1 Tax=Arthrobacter sp. Leaf234 TaxID=1736303 RepID=UPI0007015B89|nr:hypothetical protein [Arthrobacter sp. Leaf234]KQN99663.1 hypothetical protein ASF21_12710 [Arthrobacter sp. Leaf234]
MTITTIESRTGQGATLNETSTAQVIQFLSQTSNVDVSDTLVALWAESTPVDADNGYAQQARILAAILDRHVNAFTVSDAMEAVGKIWALEHGACVTELYGHPNTDHARDRWLRVEQENLTIAALALGGTR